MLKKEITYEDFNGDQKTDVFYFHIGKAEIVELEVEYEGGLDEAIKRIVAAKDRKALIAEFKKIILLAYGVKSEDGKRFDKNEELRNEFARTAAYDALFVELATDDNAAAEFMMGIVPRDMARAMEQERNSTPQTGSLPAPNSPNIPIV